MRLVQWLAAELILDARARLVEGGAGGDTRIDVAQVFVDLPAVAWRGREPVSGSTPVVRSLCWAPAPKAGDPGSVRETHHRERPRAGTLIIGGPGSGKSTASTMVAQLLRRGQIRAEFEEIPVALRDPARAIVAELDELCTRIEVKNCRDDLPLRVNLPDLARWMAPRDGEEPEALLWRYLAGKAEEHAAIHGITLGLPASELEGLARSHGRVLWIFDGLDEVPRSAGRECVIAVIRAAVLPGTGSGVLVTTRPQGYEGEFGDLDALVLTDMPSDLARDYGLRLLRAWSGQGDPQLNDRKALLKAEFAKSEVQALVRSPLHATMATLLIANQGALPRARYVLFEHYFETIFKRELGKHGEHGIQIEDKQLLRTLHARAGLVLHARSQGRAGARPTLSRHELRALLQALLREEEQSAENAEAIADRMLRFTADRLVLLLRITDGGFAFGIRSLQEFFAGVALVDGEVAVVRRRFDAIALNPHWSNVLGLIVSGLAVPGAGSSQRAAAREYTHALCRALNDGSLGGRAAAACIVGSRLAIAMLRETERYGGPWLHDALWEIALEALRAPVQSQSARAARGSGQADATYAQWEDGLELHVRLGALALTWQGADVDHRWRRILEAAEEMLQAGDGASSAGWGLLLAALERARPEAIRIAREHAPGTPEAAGRLLQLFVADLNAPYIPWLADFVNEHAAWFPPHEVAVLYASGWPARGVFAPWGLHLSEVPWDIPVRFATGIRCRVLPLEAMARTWSQLILPSAEASVAWQAWHKLAAFHVSPSQESLADALDALAAPGAWDPQCPVQPATAWPVHACLEFVDSAEELRSLAAHVRAGQLGDVDQWKTSEARWRAEPTPSDEELSSWLSANQRPWTCSGEACSRVFSTLMIRVLGPGPEVPGGFVKALLREIRRACEVLSSATSYRRLPVRWLELMLYWLIGETGRESPAATDVQRDLVPYDLVARAPSKPDEVPYDVFFMIVLLFPDLSGPFAESWFGTLNERGRFGANRWHTAPWYASPSARLQDLVREILARIEARPDQWGLVDALWAVLSAAPEARFPNVGLPGLPGLPADAPPRALASAAAVTLFSGRVLSVEMPELVSRLASTDPAFDLRSTLAELLAHSHGDPAYAQSVLLHMLDSAAGADGGVQDSILGALFQVLKQSARPAFTTASAWKEHRLPEPYLSGQAPEPLPPRIRSLVELSNIRLFKDTPVVDAPFPIPEPDQGQWIILVGENGTGKTTLLRVIGLALADPTVATRLLDENQPFVRNGGEGRIAIDLDTGRIEVVIRRDARTEAVVAAGDAAVPRPWIVGYGVRRGNARGEKDRAPEWGPTGEQHTLFDRPATLVNAVDWLLDLDRRVLNESRQYGSGGEDGGPRIHAATWQSVERALRALLKITTLEPEERHVMVTHPELGRVRLDALSDGYLTTTGWVIDLIARWIQRQEDLGEAVSRDLLRQMTGVVLIDEIDLHLHPRWQLRIIDDVRRLFPRLSFVVTTHNPLTLQGARPGEIFVMRRGDAGRIELCQRDIRPGHDVDRVLLEQFGIESTLDKQTRELLQRHRELLQRGVGADEPERAGLEVELATRLGRVGEVLVDERGHAEDPTRPWGEADRALLERFRKGKA